MAKEKSVIVHGVQLIVLQLVFGCESGRLVRLEKCSDEVAGRSSSG